MNYKKFFAQLFLFISLIICLLPQVGYFGADSDFWYRWANHIFLHGLGNIYDIDCNYPPIFLYFLKLFACLHGSSELIEKNIVFVKFFPLLFDLLPIAILAIYRKSDIKNNIHYFLLFNIAYFYNTLMWGQVDGVHSNLVFVSLFLAMKNPLPSAILFVLALNTKLQSVVFFPVLAMIWLMKIKSIKQFLLILISCFALQTLILTPFILTHKVGLVWKMVTSSAGFYPILSLNAFNFWHLTQAQDPIQIFDTVKKIGGLTYKQLGLILFCVSSLIALLPLFIKMIKTLISKKIPFHFQELLFLSAGLVAINFFFFNAEMHERYSHPAMILFFFYGIYRQKFGLYALVSVAYFLNIETILEFLSITHAVLPIFNRVFIAILYALIWLWGVFKLYTLSKIRTDIFYLYTFKKNKHVNL